MKPGWLSSLPEEAPAHKDLFFQPPVSTQSFQRGSEGEKEHMETPPGKDRGNVTCSWGPRHIRVSTKGAQPYSLHTCLPGMLWFRGHASASELTYLGCATLATPARQPQAFWGHICPRENPKISSACKERGNCSSLGCHSSLHRACGGRKGSKRA